MSTTTNPTFNFKRLLLEVLVVFLGVTAGFLLNNWRNDQESVELKHHYLVGFVQDLDDNIGGLKEDIESDSVWLAQAMPLLVHLIDHEMEVDSANKIMRLILETSRLDLRDGTFQDIMNSGNLNIIQDYGLRSSIIDYYKQVDGVMFLDEYYYSYFTDFIMPFLVSDFDLIHGQAPVDQPIDALRLTNVFAGYVSLKQQRIKAYTELLESSQRFRAEVRRNLI